MMFQDLHSLLSRFGLKGNDAKILLALLVATDGLQVYELVTQTKLKRSSVDLILKRLVADGYATRIKVGKRYRFCAEKPEAILFRKEQAVSDFRDLLPFLAKLGSGGEATNVRFFEGADGIRKIYDDVLMQLALVPPQKRILLSFSSGAHIMRIFPEMRTAFIRKRIALRAPYRAIAPRTSKTVAEWTNDDADLRTVKYVDEKKFPFKVTMEIYGDSVMILSPFKPLGGVIIENGKIAESMRSLFHLVWELLPD